MSIIYTDNSINYLGENPTEDLHFGTIQKDTDGNIWVGGINEKEERQTAGLCRLDTGPDHPSGRPSFDPERFR